MYEKVKKNFYSNMEKDSQIMLLPDIIELSHKEKSIVKENTELFFEYADSRLDQLITNNHSHQYVLVK